MRHTAGQNLINIWKELPNNIAYKIVRSNLPKQRRLPGSLGNDIKNYRNYINLHKMLTRRVTRLMNTAKTLPGRVRYVPFPVYKFNLPRDVRKWKSRNSDEYKKKIVNTYMKKILKSNTPLKRWVQLPKNNRDFITQTLKNTWRAHRPAELHVTL
jgi:hypothetical protein